MSRMDGKKTHRHTHKGKICQNAFYYDEVLLVSIMGIFNIQYSIGYESKKSKVYHMYNNKGFRLKI